MMPSQGERRAAEGVTLALVLVIPVAVYTGARNSTAIKALIFGLAIALLVGLWLGYSLFRRRLVYPRSPLNLPLLCFLGVAALSTLVSRYKYASISDLSLLAAYAAFFFVALFYLREREEFNRLIAALALVTLAVSVYGVIQRLGLDWVRWRYPGQRIPSSFGNPTFFAGFLVLVIPVMLNEAWRCSGRRRLVFAGIAGLAMLNLLWTYTRAAWGGLVIALPVNAYVVGRYALGKQWRPRLRHVAVAGAAAAVIAGALIWLTPKAQLQRITDTFVRSSFVEHRRTNFWIGAARIWRDYPVLGTGLATYKFYLPAYQPPQYFGPDVPPIIEHAHNEYLELLADTGIAGLAAFVWLLAAFFGLAWRIVRKSEDPYWQFVTAGFAAGALAFLIQNMAGVTFHWTAAAMFFWLALAAVAAAWRNQAQEGAQNGDDARTPAAYGEVTWRRLPRLVNGIGYVALAAVLVGVSVTAVKVFAAEIHFKAGQSSVSRGQWDEAENELRKAISANRYCLGAYYQLGHALNMMGRFPESLDTYRRLESLCPHYARIHFNLAAVLTNLRRYEDALPELKKAVLLEDSPVNHVELADAYRRAGELDRAVRHAERAAELEPDNADHRILLADLRAQASGGAAASEDYAKALDLDPESKAAHFRMGNAHSAKREWEQAIEEYKQAAAIDPSDPRIPANMGATYYHLGQYDKAREALKEATDPPGLVPEAHFNLGLTLLKLGEREKAKRQFELAASYGGETDLALRARAMAERLGGEGSGGAGR